MTEQVIDWMGQSGKLYRYWFMSSLEAALIKNEGGNYAFVKQLPDGKFLPLYFGESDNLQARIPNHERWEDAKKAGATHAMTHTTPAGEQARLSEERDLIQYWNPTLNSHHRSVG